MRETILSQREGQQSFLLPKKRQEAMYSESPRVTNLESYFLMQYSITRVYLLIHITQSQLQIVNYK